jgi:hypothetical protein
VAPSYLPIGTWVRIEKPELQSIVDRLRELGYRVVGPTLGDGAVVYGEITTVAEMPIGHIDVQDGGYYRLIKTDEPSYFDYVVGPHSLKNYLFPSQATLLEGIRADGSWQMRVPDPPAEPWAVIGPRSCDLHALRVQDRVFLQDRFVDPAYASRRKRLFVAAVNCRRAASTCFCHSMNTGPAVNEPFDLAMTELSDRFVIEVGSEEGANALASAQWVPCTIAEIDEAQRLPRELAREMAGRATSAGQTAGRSSTECAVSDGSVSHGRHLETAGIRELLMSNLEHPRWDEVAERCLACANCTMVCPTCFCSRVDEVTDLAGESFRRDRSWDSCFGAEHSFMSAGSVR